LSNETHDPGSLARKWWAGLQPDAPGRGDRAALARLRRSQPADAMTHEATLALFRALYPGSNDHRRLPRVATLACILAHVREDDGRKSFARAIGRTSFDDEDSAALKPLRFQRLVTAQGEDEMATLFRRAIALVGRCVDVADLARIILAFDSDETKRRLTFDYFGAGLAAAAA
jgi:CRISPR system Cascade subunit CasB